MIYSKKLLEFKEIIHGFTTREDGDMRKLKNELHEGLVLANQIHGDKITVVNERDNGGFVKETDGLVTTDKGVRLGIRTADCVPVLFYEPVNKIVGAVHAGWKGSRMGIAGKMVKKIFEMGGIKDKIFCIIGPHICEKCYDIDQDRANLFDKKYVTDSHLDLLSVNKDQLLRNGILEKNIEIFPYCTYHQNELLFSYRKNKQSFSVNSDKDYGEMLSFIELKS